jgi:hypothetical protein
MSYEDLEDLAADRHQRLSPSDFTERFGADPQELEAVAAFAERSGLTVTKASAGRRTVELSGTAAQFESAFGVTLGRYSQPNKMTGASRRPAAPVAQYRGRDGFVHVPADLVQSIVGVFGLDNRRIGHRANNPGDPPITNPITVQQAAQLYNFPSAVPAIANQTIGIIAPTGGYGGFLQSDIDSTFAALGPNSPQVTSVPVLGFGNGTATSMTTALAAAGTNSLSLSSIVGFPLSSVGQFTTAGQERFVVVEGTVGLSATVQEWDQATQNWTNLLADVPAGVTIFFNLDPETNQDICIAASAAQGANIAVYFTDDTQNGWVQMINRVLEPQPGDLPPGVPPPSVLTASWSIAAGDDPDGLAWSDTNFGTGVTTNALDAMTLAFQDAAILQAGPTICIASGDMGSNCYLGWLQQGDGSWAGDGFAHVVYPASDPWVLSVGGTTLGQYQPAGSSNQAWVEYPWNDAFANPQYPWGTGGGGVSDFFPVPSYQNAAGVPQSLNVGLAPAQPVTVHPPTPFNPTGRGVPDVAGNASVFSGFSGFYLGGSLSSDPANGTSASTPLWAGLIALLNANLGFNIGFANAALYSFGPGAFNPINPLWPDPAYPQLVDCPTDNGNNTVPGYPAQPGWDAFTGLGSPNGMALLAAFQQMESVYILGGYQSPDVVLTDLSTSQPVAIGGLPGGPWDTLLEPATAYGFSANVHNDSATTANDIVVSFWAIPGGLGTSGSMVGVPQTVSIPPLSTANVAASAPFLSAPLGQHLCAVVSISGPGTGSANAAATALDIPDPGYSLTHESSAWRNTDSTLVRPGQRFRVELSLGALHKKKVPIHLQLRAAFVPRDWRERPSMRPAFQLLEGVGARPAVPLYILPGFSRELSAAELRTKLEFKGGEQEKLAPGEWALMPAGSEKPVVLELSAEAPANLKHGDVILLTFRATHPADRTSAARTVEFVEFVHVSNGPD